MMTRSKQSGKPGQGQRANSLDVQWTTSSRVVSGREPKPIQVALRPKGL